MTWLSCFAGGRRTVTVEIYFPDASKFTIEYSRTARTRQLITTAVDHLRLKREGEYFGLAFKSKNGCDHYLDPNKCLHDQLPKTTHNQNKPALRFRVRFYPPDPQRLKEEAARHWLYLQMRADMLSGSLDASDEASAELAAYAAQAELGDYGSIKEGEYEQIKLLPRVMGPSWTEEVQNCHRQLLGLSRQESEQRFLWRVRKLTRYGEQRFRLHPTTPGGKEGEAILSAKGIEIRQSSGQGEQDSQIVRWRHITQLDFREKMFELRTQNGMILPVKTIDRATCKALFQQASGHHSLFRHYKERDHDRDASKYSFKYFERHSFGAGRESKRENPGMFTDKSDAESMAGRTANGSVSRFPPAKRDRRRSRERGAKTSGDESDDTQRQRRNRRRQERMRAVMTDTEVVKDPHRHHSRMAGGSTERLVQPQFPSNGIQAKVRSKRADMEARQQLWANIEKELVEPGQNGVEDLGYTEITTKGNPLNATRRNRKKEEQQTASTGKLSNYTPRRRRRDRVERAVATDWEGNANRDSGMVGPLPVTSAVLRDERAAMSDWDVKFYPGRSTNQNNRRPLGESNFSPVKRKEQPPTHSSNTSRSRNINFNNANGSFNLYGTQV